MSSNSFFLSICLSFTSGILKIPQKGITRALINMKSFFYSWNLRWTWVNPIKKPFLCCSSSSSFYNNGQLKLLPNKSIRLYKSVSLTWRPCMLSISSSVRRQWIRGSSPIKLNFTPKQNQAQKLISILLSSAPVRKPKPFLREFSCLVIYSSVGFTNGVSWPASINSHGNLINLFLVWPTGACPEYCVAVIVRMNWSDNVTRAGRGRTGAFWSDLEAMERNESS